MFCLIALQYLVAGAMAATIPVRLRECRHARSTEPQYGTAIRSQRYVSENSEHMDSRDSSGRSQEGLRAADSCGVILEDESQVNVTNTGLLTALLRVSRDFAGCSGSSIIRDARACTAQELNQS